MKLFDAVQWGRLGHAMALGVLVVFALPAVAGASSFVSSLIQGLTPEQAVQVLAEQFDNLTGRVTELEAQQAETALQTEQLTQEQQTLQEETAATLEKSKTELLALRDQLDQTVTGSVSDRERLRNELSAAISDLTRDRDLLREKLSISESDLSETEKEKASLVAEVKDLKEKVRCQVLFARTPLGGDGTYQLKNIEKYYQTNLRLAAEHIMQTEVDVIIQKAFQDAANAAKPMLDAYIKECGDYRPS